MWKSRTLVVVMAAVLVLVDHVGAQAPPRREASPGDAVRSPEVLDDKKVVFRIYAPKADEVTVRGDWMTGPAEKLTKDDKGVWSATVGPLRADFYSYAFSVDGVKTIDPKNAMIKQGLSGLDNMVLVPGEEAKFQETQAVSHGDVRKVWYDSKTLGAQRRMHVYTPPGYDASAGERYPVLYLLHGGGDEDSGWSTIGRAGFIMDNLLAEKKARPMIVVMPNGSLPRPANVAAATPGAARGPEFAAAMAGAQERFTNELMMEIVPFVEKNLRALPGRENRAIAGLSMGGGQTLRVIVSNPEQFAYVSVWSAGIGGQNAGEWEKRNAEFLSNAGKVNESVKLFSIVVGEQDFALQGSKNLAETLSKHGVKNELKLTGGGHTWINWRQYLHELGPRLFR
jgi:enterochelin esterase family protein